MGNVFMSEPWMIDLLKKLGLKEGMSFLDIGANIGQTLLKVQSVSPQVHYYGCEPNSVCINYLRELIEVNDIKNAHIIPIAIAEETSVLELHFYSDKKDDTTASIVSDFRNSHVVTKKEFIPAFSFNSLRGIFKNQNFYIVKIDVEGAELEVLQGLRPVLIEQKPFVLLEVLPAYNAENKKRLSRQQAIESLLHECSYKIYRVLKRENSVQSLLPLNEFGIHGNLEECDYLLAPAERNPVI